MDRNGIAEALLGRGDPKRYGTITVTAMEWRNGTANRPEVGVGVYIGWVLDVHTAAVVARKRDYVKRVGGVAAISDGELLAGGPVLFYFRRNNAR